jgi:hypothetical protein
MIRRIQMDDQAGLARKTVDEISKTASRLARRMGAEFVLAPEWRDAKNVDGILRPKSEQLPLRLWK